MQFEREARVPLILPTQLVFVLRPQPVSYQPSSCNLLEAVGIPVVFR